jgi:hypothetical protein
MMQCRKTQFFRGGLLLLEGEDWQSWLRAEAFFLKHSVSLSQKKVYITTRILQSDRQ